MTQSNEHTIEQMNREIFDFTGYKHSEHKDIDDWEMKRLTFHKSWDSLMFVIEKIETPKLDEKGQRVIRAAADVKILYRACIIEYSPDEESGDTNEEITIQTQGETKLEAVYKAVFQFITWYNQQTTTNESKPEQH